MAPEPELIAALQTALTAEPENQALRAHLAGLLLEAGRAREALEQAEILLATQPDHLPGLELAATAAEAVGDHTRAASWRRLVSALDGPSSDAEPVLPIGNADRGSAVGAEGQEVRAPGPSPQGDLDAELRDLLADAYRDRVVLGDVAGLEEVKSRLEAAFLGPMSHPELRKAYGTSMRGGLLLWGPPGCGKTFLARAVAGELGAHFLTVGLHDVLDMWLGNSEKRLHDIFEYVRRNRPSVLFFDEVDAIGHSRSDLARSASRNVVAQLLAEMDGVDTNNEGLFLIGATNQPWDVDPALRRPGRFDRLMLVLPPDEAAREAILRYHLRDRPFEGESLAEIVASSAGFSGADLRLVAEEAAQAALAAAVRDGGIRPIRVADLKEAVARIRPSTAAWLEMASNFVTYANATGDYDELMAYLRSHRLGRR